MAKRKLLIAEQGKGGNKPMKTEVVKYTCDVCGKELTENEVFKNIYYPLIFTTNQQDGSSSKSYIENKHIDLCNECANKTLMIVANGAMGHDTLRIRNLDEECGEDESK